MPELSVKRGNSNLTWALSNLGLADLFKPGFAQLYDISDYKWLSVSGIIHKTHMDIQESGDRGVTGGTEAPAVAQQSPVSNNMINNPMHPHAPHKPPVLHTVRQGSGAPAINVKIDKPFIYFVFDNVSGLVMVMGKFGREPVNYRLPI